MALRRAACELSKRIAGQQQAGALAPISTAALLRALDLDPSNSTAHPSSLTYKPSQDSFDHFAVRGFSSRPPASNPQAVHYPSATARVGAPAPIFKATAVVDNEFKTVSLEDYKGKFVVLFFYPKDFTFVCPTEIIAFSDRAKEFEQLNTQLIAASCDTEETHLAWIRTPRSRGGLGHMQIPILADTTKIISAKYGVLVRDAGVALRGLFVINPEGNIEQITINNMPIGRSVDETLRLVQAIQYVREHGEVCPADWKPGAPTMVADPEKSQEYFAAHGSDDEAPIAAKLRAISSRKEFDDVINSGKPTVVDFYAPWCGKCRQLGPFLDDMVDRFPHVEFVKVDTTAEQMDLLSAEAGVKALPAVQFYKGGKQAVPEVSGYKKKVLEDTLSKFAA